MQKEEPEIRLLFLVMGQRRLEGELAEDLQYTS